MRFSRIIRKFLAVACGLAAIAVAPGAARAQLKDVFQAPNAVNEGIHKTFAQEIGAGRGDIFTPGSSLFIIGRDPFRAVRRGRQLFQRKFWLGRRSVGRPAPGQHQPRSDDRRRARRFVRRLPRPPARLGRPRRQHVHAARQPRRATSVRRRVAGDARRRDHRRAAPDPRRRDHRRAHHAHDPDRRPGFGEGAELRPAHRAPQRPDRHVGRHRNQRRSARASVPGAGWGDLDPRDGRRRAQGRDGARGARHRSVDGVARRPRGHAVGDGARRAHRRHRRAAGEHARPGR